MPRAPKKPPVMQGAAAQDRYDGMADLYRNAAPSANRKSLGCRLTQFDLESAYANNATAARIVDTIAEESVRPGFNIDTDEDFDPTALKSWWEDLKLDDALMQAFKYARLYGGGAVMLITNQIDERKAFSKSEQVIAVRAVASIEMSPEDEQITDPYDLGMPLIWNVDPIFGGTAIPVHNSRLLKISGRSQPVSWRKMGNGSERYFGMSVLQGLLEDIEDFDDCHQWATLLLKRLQQGVWYGDGIADACETKAGTNSVQRRLGFVDGVRSAKSTIAVDKANEDYKLLNGSLAGVTDLLKAKATRITQSTGIPAIILTGDTSGALNRSAEGSMSGWEDTIDRNRTLYLRDVYQRLINIGAPELKEYNVDWNPLTQETPPQRAERIYKESQADNAYVTNYVLSVKELRDTMAKRGDYVLGVSPPVPPQVVTEDDANPTSKKPTGRAK